MNKSEEYQKLALDDLCEALGIMGEWQRVLLQIVIGHIVAASVEAAKER
jgi:hypothetical protein